jgi:hypothetical protein
VPAALARTIALLGATSGPENSIVTGIVAHTGCTTSRATNSSVTAGLSPFFLAWLWRCTATAAAMPTASATTVPMVQRLRAMRVISSESFQFSYGAERESRPAAVRRTRLATNRARRATNCTASLPASTPPVNPL